MKDAKTTELIVDLAENEQSLIICHGGRGGRGNKRFATPTNRTPREVELGGEGEKREVLLELKLIADVGVVGKPNAGKSTLLARVTRATPEIAAAHLETQTCGNFRCAQNRRP